MPNTYEWYAAAFDVARSSTGPRRTSRFNRHISEPPPGQPGNRYEAAEILTNAELAVVWADNAKHLLIQADTEVFWLRTPAGGMTGTVPVPLRALISARFEGLGYTSAEIAGTEWVFIALLRLFSSKARIIEATTEPNPGDRTVRWDSGVFRTSPYPRGSYVGVADAMLANLGARVVA